MKLLLQERGQEGKQKTTADVRGPGRVFQTSKSACPIASGKKAEQGALQEM